MMHNRNALIPVMLLVLLQAACATTTTQATRSDRNRIEGAELSEAAVYSAYELIERLRPEWLRTRPNAPQIVVFVNGARRGSAESLRDIAVHTVGLLEYLERGAAQQEFTTRTGRDVAGVIHVYTHGVTERRAAREQNVAGPGMELALLPGGMIAPLGMKHGDRFREDGWEPSTGEHTRSAIQVSARFRPTASPSLSAEVVAGRRFGEYTESYSRLAGSVHYRQTSSTGGVLVGYEWKPLRVSAGPGIELLSVEWAAGECVCLMPGNSFLVLPGALVDAAVQLPAPGRFFAAVRLQHGFYFRRDLPNFGHTPAIEVGGHQWYFGLGGGLRIGQQ